MDELASSENSIAAGSPPKRTRTRKAILALAVAAFSTVLVLILLEVGIRVADRWNLVSAGQWESRPGVRIKLSPKAEGMNREGFRDIDRPFEKPDGVYRVLFLGDSYVWGTVDYEENFPTLLEGMLNDLEPEQEIEIVNLGVPSYGPVDSLDLWKGYGHRYEPDAVVFGFYYGNDITDNPPGEYYASVLGERVRIRVNSLVDKSRLWVFLRAKSQILRFRMSRKPEASEGLFTETEIQQALAFEMAYFDPTLVQDLEILRWYFHLGIVLGHFKEYAAEQETPLFVVTYPSEVMVDHEKAEAVAATIGRPIDDFDFALPRAFLKSLLGDLGMESGDITVDIAFCTADAELYRDTHWNAEGNRCAAEAMTPLVQEFLRANGLRFGKK